MNCCHDVRCCKILIGINKVNYKVIGVAFEPWESELMLDVLARIKDSGKDVNVAMIVADTFQMRYEKHKNTLEKNASEYGIKIFVLEEYFNKWNKKQKANELNDRYILNNAKNYNIKSSTRVLMRSDHIFSCYERSPYYGQVKEGKQYEIFNDILVWVKKVIENYKPDLIFTFGNNYLVKNIIYQISLAVNVRFLTLITARLHGYYYFHDSFGVGVSNEIMSMLPNITDMDRENAYNFLCDVRSKQIDKKLYSGMTESRVNLLQKGKKEPIKYLLYESVQLMRAIINPIRYYMNGEKDIFNEVVYGSSLWRVQLFELRVFINKIKYLILPLENSINSVPDYPYILYPLHVRPESTTLTLGAGADDEEVIDFIDRRIPIGVKLLVKENPAMIGERKKSFYKYLKKKRNVVLVDPMVSTIDLVKNALGVVGISGTMLLEAALENIPVHALGWPEYREFLSSYGWDSLDEFMVCCSKKKGKKCRESILSYIALVEKKKVQVDMGWEIVYSADIKKKSSLSISNMLMKEMGL